jgi:hypothetical protein
LKLLVPNLNAEKIDARSAVCFNHAVQYWRDLSGKEQNAAIEKAELFFAAFASTDEIKQDFSMKDFKIFLHLAENQLATTFDLPESFSARAREGLLASLIICAANEEKFGEPYSDQTVAQFHALLVKV